MVEIPAADWARATPRLAPHSPGDEEPSERSFGYPGSGYNPYPCIVTLKVYEAIIRLVTKVKRGILLSLG